MPGLARLHDEYQGRAEVLAISIVLQGGDEAFMAWMRQFGGGRHAYASDPGLQVARAYGIASTGYTVIIDRDGRIALRTGPPGLDFGQLEAAVVPLLG